MGLKMLRSDRVRSLRLTKNYTHAELAELLDIGVRQIARYESGDTEPTGTIVANMAKVFGVSTDYLLGKIDDPSPYIRVDNLSDVERHVIAALRRGERLEAIKAIVESD